MLVPSAQLLYAPPHASTENAVAAGMMAFFVLNALHASRAWCEEESSDLSACFEFKELQAASNLFRTELRSARDDLFHLLRRGLAKPGLLALPRYAATTSAGPRLRRFAFCQALRILSSGEVEAKTPETRLRHSNF